MRKRLIASTAVLLLALAGTAHAADTTQASASTTPHHSAGYPLMKGLSGPDELARLMDASLAKDPTGNARLDAAACAANGSCATPKMYYDAIKTWHKRVNLGDISELPRYVRSLSKQKVVGGRYLSARLIQVNGQWQLDLDSGFTRQLGSEEWAWYDTQAGEVMMLGDCGNVADFIAESTVEVEECGEIDFPNDGTHIGVNIGLLGNQELPPSTCWGIKWAGMEKRDRILADHCPEFACNFTNDVNATGRKLQRAISERPKHVGKNVLYVPLALTRGEDIFTTVICWTQSFDGKIRHSNALGIRTVHYVNGVATIKPTDIIYPQ